MHGLAGICLNGPGVGLAVTPGILYRMPVSGVSRSLQ